MAWYNMTYSCGHETREQLYGPTKDREYRISRAKTSLCPECYRAKMIAEKQAKTDALKATMPALPALTGSDKQIAWADKLRTAVVAKLYATPNLNDIAKRLINAMVNDDAHLSAGWWINKCSQLPETTAGNMIMLEYGKAHPELCIQKEITMEMKNGVLKSDYDALVALHNSTNGPGWENNDGWLTEKPVSEWYGVTVEGGRVTGLYLYNNQLTGGLPETINLPNCKILI